MLWKNDNSWDLSLWWVSDRYPILYKAPGLADLCFGGLEIKYSGRSRDNIVCFLCAKVRGGTMLVSSLEEEQHNPPDRINEPLNNAIRPLNQIKSDRSEKSTSRNNLNFRQNFQWMIVVIQLLVPLRGCLDWWGIWGSYPLSTWWHYSLSMQALGQYISWGKMALWAKQFGGQLIIQSRDLF